VFTTLRNAWKIADLRKKILFTLFIIVLYRLGNADSGSVRGYRRAVDLLLMST
jgi:hypothetical protein